MNPAPEERKKREKQPAINEEEKMSDKEIRINQPVPFTGDRNDLESFLQDCLVYLNLNEKVYSNDAKRIAFILSFMTGGTARAWKEAHLAEIFSTSPPKWGTADELLGKLRTAFSASDTEGEARAQLRQLKQGKGTADEYISQFRILAGRSKITDDKALIEYFMEGIHTSILAKIFALDPVPTTIKDWYEKASRFDAQYRRFQEIAGRKKGTMPFQKKPANTPRYVHSHDPNAIDIDRLSTEERECHLKERRCFNCHRPGHLARDCRSNPTSTSPNNDSGYVNKFQGMKKTASTARAMIRNLIEDMDPEEKEKLMDEVAKDGDF